MRDLVHDQPDAVLHVLEEVVEESAETQGIVAAVELVHSVLSEPAMVTAVGGEVVISDDIDVDDYEVTSKTDRKGVVTKKKVPYQGTLKSLLRRLRMTLPVTRFLALEDDAREFLLYAIINAHWKRGGTLIIPDYLKRKSLAADEY